MLMGSMTASKSPARARLPMSSTASVLMRRAPSKNGSRAGLQQPEVAVLRGEVHARRARPTMPQPRAASQDRKDGRGGPVAARRTSAASLATPVDLQVAARRRGSPGPLRPRSSCTGWLSRSAACRVALPVTSSWLKAVVASAICMIVERRRRESVIRRIDRRLLHGEWREPELRGAGERRKVALLAAEARDLQALGRVGAAGCELQRIPVEVQQHWPRQGLAAGARDPRVEGDGRAGKVDGRALADIASFSPDQREIGVLVAAIGKRQRPGRAVPAFALSCNVHIRGRRCPCRQGRVRGASGPSGTLHLRELQSMQGEVRLHARRRHLSPRTPGAAGDLQAAATQAVRHRCRCGRLPGLLR